MTEAEPGIGEGGHVDQSGADRNITSGSGITAVSAGAGGWGQPAVPYGGDAEAEFGSGVSAPGECFIPEAKVLMADKTYKSIIDIQIGDKVMGLSGVNTVIHTPTFNLGVNSLHGFNDIAPFITCMHPIKTDKGWANFNPDSYKQHWPTDYALIGNENGTGEVLKLQEGDNIQFYNPGFKPLENHVIEKRDEDFKVYNLTLDGDHTFVVEGIVVHNKGGGDTVICTELYAQGLLSKELHHAAHAYQPFSNDAHNGYHLWAIPFVRQMAKE